MRIEVNGASAISAKLHAAAEAGPQAVAAALFVEAEAIMTVSKEQYVPVDTGALRASGHVVPPKISGTNVMVELGYGGPSAPYAVIVHEDLTKRHKVGQAKYLEIPLRARLAGMPAVLAMRTRNAIQQAFQRLGRIEGNVVAGRDPNAGQPLFR